METMVTVPASLLITLVSIANHHVENVESGLQGGTYKAADFPDLQQLKVDLARVAGQLADNPQNEVWLTTLPVLSTNHLSQETGTVTLAKGFPWLAVAEYETGFFVKVDKQQDHFQEYPQDLRDVMAWAAARQYDWIRLDAEGDDVDGLPIYDW